MVSIHAHQFHGGRPWVRGSMGRMIRVSIHAHQFHGGRRSTHPCPRHPGIVSIHAHQFHGGRQTSFATPTDIQPTFQSTPTNFMAGDVISRAMSGAPVDVSIHAHQFHGGRLLALDALHQAVDVSIHAHQFHGGRPCCTRIRAAPRRRFNPRPPISWRATRCRP